MYIQASQQERELSINTIYNNETLYSSIRCIAEEILGRLMESRVQLAHRQWFRRCWN